MQVYIRIFLVFIHIYWNICMIPVINQLWPAGPADTRMHDRPARPTAFCWNQKYPRICGEKSPASEVTSGGWGLPPHMRGKVPSAAVLAVSIGITPAYAGKSTAFWSHILQHKDHPRICREKGCVTFWFRNHSGSPPHMQGKGLRDVLVPKPLGITPAYAGKRACQRSKQS